MGSGASVYHAEEEPKKVDCRVWTNVNQPSFQHPEQKEITELSEKVDVGVGLSGGGMRAATLCLGWLRGLHELQLLEKIKYASSTSGSTWTHGPLTYLMNREEVNTYLGPYIPPNECTRATLKSRAALGSHANRLADANIITKFLYKEMHRQVTGGVRSTYCRSVAETFFSDLVLNKETKTQGDVSITARQLRPNPYTYLRSLPYPIMTGSIFVGGKDLYLPLEFTPLYYGLPARKCIEEIGLLNKLCCCLSAKKVVGEVGGYLIEPHGFVVDHGWEKYVPTVTYKPSQTSEICSTSTAEQTVETLSVINSKRKISLSECSGISSSAVSSASHGGGLSVDTADFLGFPGLNIWDPITGKGPFVRLGDGGVLDNYGIMSLLRRKMNKMIICCAGIDRVDGDIQASFYDLASFFGARTLQKAADGSTAEQANKRDQVFPKECFAELFNGLKKRSAEGRGASYLLKTTVMKNEFVGVLSEHEVSIVFIMNDIATNWRDALPEDAKDQFTRDQKVRSERLHNAKTLIGYDATTIKFPFIATFTMNYSPFLVNAMGQKATWEVLQAKDLIDELLK